MANNQFLRFVVISAGHEDGRFRDLARVRTGRLWPTAPPVPMASPRIAAAHAPSAAETICFASTTTRCRCSALVKLSA